MQSETLYFPGVVEVRSTARKGSIGVLAGRAAVFYDGTPETEFRIELGAGLPLRERVSKTAFDAHLAAGDEVLALSDHAPENRRTLGRRTSGTLRLSTDAKGLNFEVDLPDTTEGRDVRELADRGDLRGASFGFKPYASGTKMTYEEDDDGEIRTLEAVALTDIAPTIIPAYEATSAALRSRAGLAEARSAARRRRLEEIHRLTFKIAGI